MIFNINIWATIFLFTLDSNLTTSIVCLSASISVIIRILNNFELSWVVNQLQSIFWLYHYSQDFCLVLIYLYNSLDSQKKGPTYLEWHYNQTDHHHLPENFSKLETKETLSLSQLICSHDVVLILSWCCQDDVRFFRMTFS